MGFPELLDRLPPALRIITVVLGATAVGLAAHAVLFRSAATLGRWIPAVLVFDGALLRRSRRPMRLLLPLLAVHWALPLLGDDVAPGTWPALETAFRVLLVAAVAWMLIALTRVLDDVVSRHFDVSAVDNLRARRVRTQVSLLRRVIVFAIVLLAVGAVLMQFEGFRAIGAGLLASAGVAGIVFGIAAQRPLGSIVAGVQLALSQPIRVGDAVVMENEWGTVEEITLSYVVVRIWDQRRLVLPISYFFERPFQNWTRTSAQIIGTVFLWVDYLAPVDAIRAEHDRIVRASRFWDGQVCALHVTDSSDRALQLRAIMSAADAGRAWDLRCEVREKLVAFLQRSYPETLPRLRVAEVAAREERPPVAPDGPVAGTGPGAGPGAVPAPSRFPADLGRDDARR